MIKIIINGEMMETTKNISLHLLLEKRNYRGDSFAVAVNQTFIPHSQFTKTCLANGDVIEILMPMQGG